MNLLPGEVSTRRHLAYADLLPDACDKALFTTLFPERSYASHDHAILSGESPRLPEQAIPNVPYNTPHA